MGVGKGGLAMESSKMTAEITREVAHELNGATKKWKTAEIIRWILTIAFLAGMYFAGFETASHAETTYVMKEIYQEHVKNQEQQYNELLRRTQENQAILRDIEKFLRSSKNK